MSCPSKAIAAGIGAVDAGDGLHQRRLAGAVVADQADHLAGRDLEIDAVQHVDRAEALADVRRARGGVIPGSPCGSGTGR